MTTHYKTLEEAQKAMKQEHLDEIDTDGTKFYYEKIIDEIVSSVWHSATAAGVEKCIEAVPAFQEISTFESLQEIHRNFGRNQRRADILEKLEALRK